MHHFLNHWSGGDGGFIYDVGSGPIATVLGLGFLSLMGWLAHKINQHTQCHDDSCHKPGIYHIAGGEHRVCRDHYLEVMGHQPGHKIDVAHLRRKHEDHVARTTTV